MRGFGATLGIGLTALLGFGALGAGWGWLGAGRIEAAFGATALGFAALVAAWAVFWWGMVLDCLPSDASPVSPERALTLGLLLVAPWVGAIGWARSRRSSKRRQEVA